MHRHRDISLLNKILLVVYSCLWTVLFKWIAPLLALMSVEVRKQSKNRNMSGARLRYIQRARIERKSACVFFCSSAGEYEQAKPLIDQLSLTHYVHVFFSSVSGYNYAKAMNETCPFDLVASETSWGWKEVFKVIKPSVTIVVRHGFWPAFILMSYQYSRLFAIDVAIRERTSVWSMNSKKYLFRFFDKVWFASSRDMELCGSRMPNYEVIGNTKFDRAFQRKQSRKPFRDDVSDRVHRFFPEKKRLVVGSAWKEDALIVLESYKLLPESVRSSWCLLLVPHDLSGENVRWMYNACVSQGLNCVKYTDAVSDGAHVLIVDQLGVLFELYGCGHSALIGGGFEQGVHNIVEPAVFNLPLSSGPFIGDDRESWLFERENLLTVVHDSQALAAWLVVQDNNESLDDRLQPRVMRSLGVAEKIIGKITPYIYENSYTS